MKNSKNLIVALALTVLAGIIAYFITRDHDVAEVKVERVRKEIYNFDAKVCPGAVVKLKMNDPYMRGLIAEGAEVEISMNYYTCNPLARNDVVLYRFSEFDDPVFRRVVAVGGDKFEPQYNEDKGAWELKINGKFVLGVKGERYLFGGEDPPPLELAANQMKHKLGAGLAIVLSSFPPGDRDSGIFGAIAVTDIVGKAMIGSAK